MIVLSIEIKINNKVIYYVDAVNINPYSIGGGRLTGDDECPYDIVTHDGKQGFIVHRRSDGALQLAEQVLDKLGLMERINQYTPVYLGEGDGEDQGEEGSNTETSSDLQER